MKRMLLEWGMFFSVGLALALTALWVNSHSVDRSTHHIKISTSKGVQNDLHFILSGGDLTLCDQFEMDIGGKVGPLIIDPGRLTPRDIARGDRAGGFTIPALDFRYCRFGNDGYL